MFVIMFHSDIANSGLITEIMMRVNEFVIIG